MGARVSDTPLTLHVVANPAAGKDEPVLATLNEALGKSVRWDISVTQTGGDGEKAVREAVAAGADVIGVYGGDGTVREVAGALADGEVPMLLLPGGTANVMAHELGVPEDLGQAARLVFGEHDVRRVDLIQTAEGARFFLRAGIGWEAETVQGADRQMKDKLGDLAYIVSGIRELLQSRPAAYRIEIDGRFVECEALSCVVANSAALGVGDVTLHPDVRVDDGALDVLLLRKGDPASLLALAAAAVKGEALEDVLGHYQGREVRVECEPAQAVVLDGEDAGSTPLRAHVLPGAVPVIVPVAEDARGSRAKDEGSAS